MITISPETIEDAVGIRDVQYQTWLATYPNDEYGITRDDIEEFWRPRMTSEGLAERKKKFLETTPNEQSFVAKEGDRIVGFCRCIRHTDANELKAIYVHPDFQGNGIGQQLWQEAQTFFDPTKDTIVKVAVYNEDAIRFYQKLGFTDTGRRMTPERLHFKSGATMPEMEMNLSAMIPVQ